MRKRLTMSASAPAEAADATLELTFLAVERCYSPKFLKFLDKANPGVSAWVDPAHKRSTRSLHCALHLPLSLDSLQNPSSSLTIQILPSCLHLQSSYPSASVPLASLPTSGDPLTLHLRRPCGRATGFVRFSARVLWSLGPHPVRNCPTGVEALAALRFLSSISSFKGIGFQMQSLLLSFCL